MSSSAPPLPTLWAAAIIAWREHRPDVNAPPSSSSTAGTCGRTRKAQARARASPLPSAGAGPDTISSDMHVFSGNSPGMPFLTWVMSKFLNMGFSLEQVVAMATINAARAINRVPKLGTLEVGAPGDVTVLEVVEGPVEFVDTRNNKRPGKVHIRPVNTVRGGIAYGRPFSAPFSVS